MDHHCDIDDFAPIIWQSYLIIDKWANRLIVWLSNIQYINLYQNQQDI